MYHSRLGFSVSQFSCLFSNCDVSNIAISVDAFLTQREREFLTHKNISVTKIFRHTNIYHFCFCLYKLSFRFNDYFWFWYLGLYAGDLFLNELQHYQYFILNITRTANKKPRSKSTNSLGSSMICILLSSCTANRHALSKPSVLAWHVFHQHMKL